MLKLRCVVTSDFFIILVDLATGGNSNHALQFVLYPRGLNHWRPS